MIGPVLEDTQRSLSSDFFVFAYIVQVWNYFTLILKKVNTAFFCISRIPSVRIWSSWPTH